MWRKTTYHHFLLQLIYYPNSECVCGRDRNIYCCCRWLVNILSWDRKTRTENMESQVMWPLSIDKHIFPLGSVTEMYFLILRILILEQSKKFIWYFKDDNRSHIIKFLTDSLGKFYFGTDCRSCELNNFPNIFESKVSLNYLDTILSHLNSIHTFTSYPCKTLLLYHSLT